MIQFFMDNVGYFAALLPVGFMIAWAIACRGTKLKINSSERMALFCHLKTINWGEDSWELKE